MGTHPTVLLDPGVVLGAGVDVGPYCRFEGRVRVGPGCRFATGVVVGTQPMDREYAGEDTAVVIGSGNVFHEYTTVHRATGVGAETVIGSDNYVMAYVHIAHNCRIGNGCTITNGVQLGGHVVVQDGANIGGLTGVHQFCRIGALAMVGVGSYVNRDILPYVIAQGRPCRVCGLNAVGLSRAGLPGAAVAVLKRAYRLLYRSDLNLSQAVERIEAELLSDDEAAPGQAQLRVILDFIASSRRGIELRSGREDQKEET